MYARRFVSDWLLVIDGTFNTNRDRLLLLIAVGVLNSERTFPVAFLYVLSESEESFIFFWDSMKAECFITEEELLPPPSSCVILGDQADGIISSVPKAFPDCQIQSYD